MFSVVMIVRDEATRLPCALESVRGAPVVVVCDTGSQDKTREIALAEGARVVKFPWCDDFAAARCFAEAHASHDWIMRLDADERVALCEPRRLSAEEAVGISRPANLNFVEALGALLEETEADALSQVFIRRRHSPGNDHWFPRIHRRSVFQWVYPVHELVKPRGEYRPRCAAMEGFVVEHEREARPRPYRSILDAALRLRPEDPYLAFHLGQACFEESDWEAVIKAFTYYQSLPGGYRFHRGEALRMEGEAWENLGDIERAFATYIRASQSEGRAEPLWQAARLALRIGDLAHAKEWAERGAELAMSPPREKQSFGGLDYPYVLDWRSYGSECQQELKQQIFSNNSSVHPS